MDIKVNMKCPNCGSNHFSRPDDPETVILISGEKSKDTGLYAMDSSKAIAVIPVHCTECGNMLLFRENK